MAGVDQLNWHRGICDCYVDACSYQITARVLHDIWYLLQWHDDGRDGVSNHQRIDCLHNCLFRRKSTKTPKLRVRPLWGEFICHRWIPLIKGQLRGKCFYFMTSSCPEVIASSWLRDEWALRWRHNGRDSISNHQPRHCLLNRLFRRRSKKTSKLRVTGLCVGNSPGTGEFPAQMASNAKMPPIDDVIMGTQRMAFSADRVEVKHTMWALCGLLAYMKLTIISLWLIASSPAGDSCHIYHTKYM